MQIREYQTWLQAYDVARGWDKIRHPTPFCTWPKSWARSPAKCSTLRVIAMHRMPATCTPTWPRKLADCATFLFKLAYLCGVDLEDALRGNMVKAENRFSVEAGRADTERYLAHQAEGCLTFRTRNRTNRNTMTKALSFQEVVMRLDRYWADHGCLIWQPYSEKMGAGHRQSGTTLRVLGPEPWTVPTSSHPNRPADGRYARTRTACSYSPNTRSS